MCRLFQHIILFRSILERIIPERQLYQVRIWFKGIWIPLTRSVWRVQRSIYQHQGWSLQLPWYSNQRSNYHFLNLYSLSMMSRASNRDHAGSTRRFAFGCFRQQGSRRIPLTCGLKINSGERGGSGQFSFSVILEFPWSITEKVITGNVWVVEKKTNDRQASRIVVLVSLVLRNE